MRPVGFLLILSILSAPARAEPLQIYGTMGYAGEYELSGSVSEQNLNGKKEFSVPLTVRHAGLCTRDGRRRPLAKSGSNSPNRRPASPRRWTSTEANVLTRGFFPSRTTALWIADVRGAFPLRLWTK